MTDLLTEKSWLDFGSKLREIKVTERRLGHLMEPCYLCIVLDTLVV